MKRIVLFGLVSNHIKRCSYIERTIDIKRPVSNNNVASYRFQLLGHIKKENPILGLQSILTKGLEKKTKINATSIFFRSLFRRNDSLSFCMPHTKARTLLFFFLRVTFRVYFVLVVGIFAVSQCMSTNYTSAHSERRERWSERE